MRGEYNLVKEYELAKGEITTYIDEMNKNIEEIKEDIEYYFNGAVDSSKLEYFNINKAVKKVRTWEIIMSDKIRVSDRNMLCAYAVADYDLPTCLSFFNGKGKNIKNLKTLSTLIYNARKKVEDIYNEMYE